VLRRASRSRRRVARGGDGRAAPHHRTEWRREDHALQHDQRRFARGLGIGAHLRRGGGRAASRPARAPRPRADLPAPHGLPEQPRAVQALLNTIPRTITIVMIEHDIDSALAFAERITLLHYGRVIVEGTRAEVVAHPRTREVYLGV